MISRPAVLSTCAIGSLPHTQLELALQLALQLDVPTLPQLPRADPAEFMLPEALEGLPGLRYDSEGRTTVHRADWAPQARAFESRLDEALAGRGLEAFEPDAAFCRAWRPFLWEIEQRRSPFAKVQLAGPLTVTWATVLDDGRPLHEDAAISGQVFKLALARGLAMTRAVAATGARPIVFLDEPGLYAFDKRRPTHVIELQELALAARALQRAGALVGLHCCGNTDWAAVFKLGLDFVSADAQLSLAPMLGTGTILDEYLARGGWLVLGLIPTTLTDLSVEDLVDNALAAMGDRRRQILARALLAPACGLALRSVPESEQVYDDLRTAQRLVRETT
jgi:hypothetical protein